MFIRNLAILMADDLVVVGPSLGEAAVATIGAHKVTLIGEYINIRLNTQCDLSKAILRTTDPDALVKFLSRDYVRRGWWLDTSYGGSILRPSEYSEVSTPDNFDDDLVGNL